MKFFKMVIKFVKRAFRKIVDAFKDKNPIEVINDTTKTVAAIATTTLAAYAGINAIRVHLIPSLKKNKDNNYKSAHEIIFENRDSGSINDKLSKLKATSSELGKRKSSNIDKEDLKFLKAIAKTRNSFFQTLSPEEQLNVLEMEDFDFKEYVKNEKAKSKVSFFKRKTHRKKSNPDETVFREQKNYGIFNFILRPLDDFIHWIKNDPIPKKVPQIQIIDHPEIPNVSCDTALDLVSTARNLDSYLSRNKTISNDINVTTPAELEEQQILAEEIFRHRSLKKLRKAVNRRMAQSNYNTPNIFDLMDDDKDFKKKKKNKKHKKHFDDFSFVDEDTSKKKKKKDMSKEDKKAESLADKRAKELYRYHLEKAMNGEFDRKGYGFDF